MSENLNSKKVLFLINSLARGGAERVFINQVNYLHQKGGLVYLGLIFPTPDNSFGGELILPQSQIFQFDGNQVGFFKLWQLIRKAVNQYNIDVVYSTLELPNILARLVKLSHPRLRVVIREGSAVVDTQGRVTIKPLKFKVLDFFLNFLANQIVAVSDEISGILKSYQPQWSHKITTLENGITITESREEVEKRATNKVDRPQFNVLAVASMNYYERAFEYLIEAISLLPEDLLSHTRLIFAGEGTLRPMYEAQVVKLGLFDQIKFLGRLDTETLKIQYQNADVFVLCSTAEGSPNVILEAASHGLPVITTRVGSAVTMVKDGETGFFIPFKNSEAIADRLLWLANNKVESRDIGLKAYDYITYNFSFDKKMAKLRKILNLD